LRIDTELLNCGVWSWVVSDWRLLVKNCY
jgi:hypothetical protein